MSIEEVGTLVQGKTGTNLSVIFFLLGIFRDLHGEAGKTRVTARVQFTSAAALKVAVDMDMLQGMSMTWDYLIEYVQELQAK